ncbi:MAG TPA: hypothetical protein VFF27_00215 [Bacteroidia bacterium]|jgi:hypothetical protein|nr:hypothetical protein [Bacteroidia bacterium]
MVYNEFKNKYMGVTGFSINLLEKYKGDSKSVCELGAQNLYDKDYGTEKGPYANVYYNSNGIEYTFIDVSKENNSLDIDLSKPQTFTEVYDLVTDFGTSEHVSDSYNCAKAIHDLVKVGGTVIQENPKTGNWPGHGFHYKTKAFYEKLASSNGYEILELGEHPAMGNNTNGWNVYCVWKKIKDNNFISKARFKELDLRSA